MVQLTEVPDEHFEQQAALNKDDDFTDTDSEISTDSEYDPSSESLADRLYALRDVIPPTTRAYIGDKVNICHRTVSSILGFSGKTLWVITSSALLFAVPFALATAEDQQLAGMEQEAKMREMGGDLMMSPSSGGGDGGGGGFQDGDTAAQVSAALGEKEARPSL